MSLRSRPAFALVLVAFGSAGGFVLSSAVRPVQASRRRSPWSRPN